MGRSGSTLLFECLSLHRDVGWLSHHADRAPRQTWRHALNRLADRVPALRKSIERSDQRRPWLEKLRLGPAEAWETWEMLCGPRFRYEYLLETRATPAEREAVRAYVGEVLRLTGTRRFAAKLTGPPRITYLDSIFPDALFLHLVRDGRAVARSLLRVDFWRESFRMREPAWKNGFPAAYQRLWEETGRSPLALAALQWRNIVEVARREAAALPPGRYRELRYEDFLTAPGATLDRLLADCGLPPDPRIQRFLERRFELRDRNADGGRAVDPAETALLDRLIGPTLGELGYAAEARRGSAG